MLKSPTSASILLYYSWRKNLLKLSLAIVLFLLREVRKFYRVRDWETKFAPFLKSNFQVFKNIFLRDYKSVEIRWWVTADASLKHLKYLEARLVAASLPSFALEAWKDLFIKGLSLVEKWRIKRYAIELVRVLYLAVRPLIIDRLVFNFLKTSLFLRCIIFCPIFEERPHSTERIAALAYTYLPLLQ